MRGLFWAVMKGKRKGLPLMNKSLLFFTGFLLLCVTVLYSGGKNEKDAVVRVTGTVRLVGSGSFPELVITGSGKEWYVASEENDKINDLQHRTVTLEGVETVKELVFASGRSAGKRRELKNIKIINIQ